jgi:hypothetical protein
MLTERVDPEHSPSARERLVVRRVAELLTSYLGGAESTISSDRTVDAVIEVGAHRFYLEILAHPSSARIEFKARRLVADMKLDGPPRVPLLVVPQMGPAGRDLCRSLGMSWIDEAGNADIRSGSLRILVEGKRPATKPRGRPTDLFAPRSSRVARALLVDDTPLTQAELVAATGLSQGFVSRIVTSLEEKGYVHRDAGKVVLESRRGLLVDWDAGYDFSRHTVVRGHSPNAMSETPATTLGALLHDIDVRHAATGLAAAWLLAPFAGFRITTFFVERALEEAELKRLQFRETDKGANVWLVVPQDAGVFFGMTTEHDIPCVHPVQAYLDLGAHPERATEAKSALVERRLGWMR